MTLHLRCLVKVGSDHRRDDDHRITVGHTGHLTPQGRDVTSEIKISVRWHCIIDSPGRVESSCWTQSQNSRYSTRTMMVIKGPSTLLVYLGGTCLGLCVVRKVPKSTRREGLCPLSKSLQLPERVPVTSMTFICLLGRKLGLEE